MRKREACKAIKTSLHGLVLVPPMLTMVIAALPFVLLAYADEKIGFNLGKRRGKK